MNEIKTRQITNTSCVILVTHKICLISDVISMSSYLWVYDFVSPALVLFYVYKFYVWLSTSVKMVSIVKHVQSHGD